MPSVRVCSYCGRRATERENTCVYHDDLPALDPNYPPARCAASAAVGDLAVTGSAFDPRSLGEPVRRQNTP